MSQAPRAIAALRAGRAISIGMLTVSAVETTTDALLVELDPDSRSAVMISGERAAALGLANQRAAAEASVPVVLDRAAWFTAADARALVDPAGDYSRFTAGPLSTSEPVDLAAASGALGLARIAGLLPALWLHRDTACLRIETNDAIAAGRSRSVSLAARAALPIAGLAKPAQIVAMRASEDGSEHVALIIGAPEGKAPLVRLHSECLTGDVFGSLKCDCGPQLVAALRLMEAQGGGILIYLRQEGRGIGLANKIRAYALQDRGLDTVEANRRLGFADDERDFALAAAMLRALGVTSVRLLTNNPAKLAGLEAEGIQAIRIAHHLPANPHNVAYLATKKARSGHLD